MSYFLHESSVVDGGVEIGEGTKIWHFCHVSAGARIGESCVFGQNTYIGNKVQIGARVKVQNNVSIYENVTIEDDVFCGPSCVFTNVVNPRSFVERKDEFRETVVEHGASLGANCTIVCGNRIGRYSLVGAGAVVTTDVKPFALVLGVPARQVGWVSKLGETLDLPLSGEAYAICPTSDEKYVLKGTNLALDAEL